MLLPAIAMLVLAGCATTRETPEGSSPADNLRKADNTHDLHGDLEVTLSRTR